MLELKEKITPEKRYDDIITYDTPAYKPRKRRRGDRKEGRLVKTLPPMSYIEPYIMKVRADSQNHFEDVIDITNIETEEEIITSLGNLYDQILNDEINKELYEFYYINEFKEEVILEEVIGMDFINYNVKLRLKVEVE